jgi:hypothetical protein
MPYFQWLMGLANYDYLKGVSKFKFLRSVLLAMLARQYGVTNLRIRA